MDSFFDRQPVLVARDLKGKTIKIANSDETITILETLPRTSKDNGPWLNSKPLFGPDPVDVYVSRHRSGLLLFFRNMENCCTRLEKGKKGDQLLATPTAVAKALGAIGEATGDVVSFNGQTIEIRWHDQPRRRK